MADVREVFEMVTKQAPPTPDALERQFREQRRSVRNRKAGAFAMAASIVLIAMIAYAILRESGPPAPPVTEAPNSSGSQDVFIDLSTGEVTPLPASLTGERYQINNYQVSPDGTELAYLSESGGMPRLFVANIDGTDVRQISPDPVWEGSVPGWSPDGTKLVYQMAPDSILVVDISTGETTEVTSARDGSSSTGDLFYQPSFSPDGRSILFTVQYGNQYSLLHSGFDLGTVSVDGGEWRSLIVGFGSVGFGSYSPDGATIAYLGEPDFGFTHVRGMVRPMLWLADSDGSNPRELVVESGSYIPMLDALRPVWSPDGTRIVYEGTAKDESVVDVATGEVTVIGKGQRPTWLDDDTVIVEEYEAH